MSAEESASLSLWSALSLLGLVLVIVGVIMEGAEAFIWTRSWLHRKRPSLIWNVLPEPHIPRWAHRLDHVGWFILVVGLALETLGHIRVTDITGRENRRLTAQLDSTTEQAGIAEKEAGESKLIAAQIGTTNAQLVGANLILQSNVFALQAAVQWRFITPMQETNIIGFFNVQQVRLQNTNAVNVDVEETDVEARWYAKRMVDVLKKCGVNAVLQSGLRMHDPESPGPFVGLCFEVNGLIPLTGNESISTNSALSWVSINGIQYFCIPMFDKQWVALAKDGNAAIIVAAFAKNGVIPTIIQSNTNLMAGDLHIVVGHKP